MDVDERRRSPRQSASAALTTPTPDPVRVREVAKRIQDLPQLTGADYDKSVAEIRGAFLEVANPYSVYFVRRRKHLRREGDFEAETVASVATDTAVRRTLARVQDHGLNKPDSWPAYLRRAVENAARDERKRLRRGEGSITVQPFESQESQLAAPSLLARRDPVDGVHDVLQSLKDLDPPPGFTPIEELAFNLRFGEVLQGRRDRPRTWQDIAHELHMSESGARALGDRAIAKFRRSLTSAGLT